MPRPTNYVTFTVHVRPDVAQKFQRVFPRYGDHSKVLRLLIQWMAEGKYGLRERVSLLLRRLHA